MPSKKNPLPSASRLYDLVCGTGRRQSSLPLPNVTARTGATVASSSFLGYPRRDPATTMYLSSGPVGDGFLNTDGLLLMMSSYWYAQTTSPVAASILRSLYS